MVNRWRVDRLRGSNVSEILLELFCLVAPPDAAVLSAEGFMMGVSGRDGQVARLRGRTLPLSTTAVVVLCCLSAHNIIVSVHVQRRK